MDELIRTKFAPPVWMGDQIRRDVLLARLDAALDKRLTLIHAPAGYGKTSLLSQWRKRHQGDDVLIAWLTLERDDTDLKRLTRYVAQAVSAAAPGDDAEGDDVTASASLPPRAALSVIVNRIATIARPVVLIFDDFHRAEGPELVEFVGALIRLAPENCHLLVASRDYPSVGQSVLLAEGQLLEFAAEDLRFSIDETDALLARHEPAGIDGADVDRIFERTEGWPLALQLIALSLRGGADHGRLIRSFSGSSAELARYLSEQVLMGLPEDIKEVVVRTSLVDRLTGDVVNMLCDCKDGWLVLEHLEQQGMFLTAISDDRSEFRYHQLFAEYLRERLAKRDREHYHALQQRAARWFADNGDIADAVNHAILADDHALLATIIDEAGAWKLIPKGMKGVVARALAQLPEPLVRARPRLVLARIYLSIKDGEMGAARTEQDWLVANADRIGVSADLWNEIHIVGDVLIEYENVPVTLDDLLAREALLRTLPANDHLMLGNYCESIGSKYYEGGWLERALEPTLAAREHHQALGSLYSDLFTRFLEARIRRAQGRLKDSAAILDAAGRQILANFGERSDLAANCAAFQSELLYEQNDLAGASALLAWSLPHMEQSDGWVDVYAAAYLTAARIAFDHGGMDEAGPGLARARRLAQRRRLRQLELLALLCELQLRLRCDGVAQGTLRYAASIGLDALADEMNKESAVYRHVAVAASLCRVRIALLQGAHAQALDELTVLRNWANRHGAGRLLMDVDILVAHAWTGLGDPARGAQHFDGAVGAAMFQDAYRPFIDACRFSAPLLERSLDGERDVDRFRSQFLKVLSKSLSGRLSDAEDESLLSGAEEVVLAHLSRGYSNKEIARLIGMSPDTVKYRLKSLFRKIGVSKRRDAVRVASERGMIQATDHVLEQSLD